jgi:hypothetical protein
VQGVVRGAVRGRLARGETRGQRRRGVLGVGIARGAGRVLRGVLLRGLQRRELRREAKSNQAAHGVRQGTHSVGR